MSSFRLIHRYLSIGSSAIEVFSTKIGKNGSDTGLAGFSSQSAEELPIPAVGICLGCTTQPVEANKTCHISSFLDLGKFVCFSQKIESKYKKDKSLFKMHFKPLGSSAVDELHKLTDYNSGH